MLEFIYGIAFWACIIYFLVKYIRKKKQHTSNRTSAFNSSPRQQHSEFTDFAHAYQKRWLFSYNEKAIYQDCLLPPNGIV